MSGKVDHTFIDDNNIITLTVELKRDKPKIQKKYSSDKLLTPEVCQTLGYSLGAALHNYRYKPNDMIWDNKLATNYSLLIQSTFFRFFIITINEQSINGLLNKSINNNVWIILTIIILN